MLVEKTRKRKKLFWSKVNKISGRNSCWLWTGAKNENGYGWITVSINGKQRFFFAHKVSFEWANGELEEGQIVRHKCDTPLCVKPSHLLAGTHQDNVDDMMERGRHVAAMAQISQQDAINIRMARHFGASAKDIALHYKLTPQHVSNICTGVYWPNAGGPLTRRFEISDDVIRQVLKDVKTMRHQAVADKHDISKAAVQQIASGKRKPRRISDGRHE